MTQPIVFEEMVTALNKPGEDIIATLTPERAVLWHMGTGVSGEAGELLDAIKRVAIYDKPIDLKNVIEELGDLEFYMEGIRQNLGITRQQTLEANIAKLLTGEKARYKLGIYSDKQAQERADKAGAQ